MKAKKLKSPVTVSTVLEKEQHDALRFISFRERIPMAELIRATLDKLISEKSKKYRILIDNLD